MSTTKLVLFDSHGKLLVENYLPYLELKQQHGSIHWIDGLTLNAVVPSLYKISDDGEDIPADKYEVMLEVIGKDEQALSGSKH